MADTLPAPTLLAIPVFVILVLVEMIYGWRTRRATFEALDSLTSLLMGLGSTIADALTFTLVYGVSYWVWENFRIFDFGYSLPVIALAFVLDDLAYYWLHRCGHRVRWMWAAHVVHHSSQHYNLTTALRQTWTAQLTPVTLFRLPIFILGIEPAIVFFCAGLNLLYQFWIHTETIRKMPSWFEAVMNTPSHHRVHHANNPRYLDANYAGVFIIWDKLFGSFTPEEETEPCRYGLVSDLGTFNPLKVAVHEWLAIARDLITARRWRDRLLTLLAPPGWTPDGSRKTSDMLKTEWQERLKQKNTG